MTDQETADKAQEDQEGAPKAQEANSGTEGHPEDSGPLDDQQPKKESFSREYVEGLRTENKEARLKASRIDWWATEARRLAVREACRGVVSDPEAVTWDDDWVTDDGIDHDAIRTAAEALAKERPWLSRPRGDVGQGQHSDSPEGISLSQLLRS